MSLRRMAIGVLLVAFLAITLAQIFIGSRMYRNGFELAERRDLLSRARHSQAAIQQSAAMLASTALDYGMWDETSRYVLGEYPTYTKENWYREAFDRLEIDGAIIFDATGKVLAASRVAGTAAVTAWDVRDLRRQIPQTLLDAWCSTDQATNGYLVLEATPYMWGAASVRMGESRAAPSGYIVFLRALDGEFTRKFRETLDADVIITVGASRSQFRRAASVPLRAEDLRFLSPAEDRLTAALELAALGSGHSVEVALTTDRVFSATVRKASVLFAGMTAAIAIVVSMLVLGFFDRRVLAPLSGMARELGDVGRNGLLAQSVSEPPTQDEIAAVARSINAMLRDLASKQGAEAERDAAVRADRLKSEFLAMISHEIRTPMNGVIGMLELLSSSNLGGATREQVLTAHGAARSLLTLVNNVLDFSKLEAGRLVLDPGPTDLVQLVKDAAALLNAQAATKGIDLSVTVSDRLHESYRVDSGRLRQVLVNLIGNAVKFTSAGWVRVGVDCSPVSDSRDQLRFTVADSGIGIAPECQHSVFEPFTQEQANTASRFGGTGLGLTITKRLVTLMGGRIELDSTPGHGSTFTLVIDFERCARAAASVDAEPELPERLGLRVLVAEDNAVNQLVVSAMLDKLGCSYEVVDNGSQAVDAIARQPDGYDLILMDINMPVLDGYEATRRIRELASQRSSAAPVPIVALTANAMETDREKTLLSGMDDFLSKPMTLQALAAVLRAVTASGSRANGASTWAAVPAIGKRL